MPPSQLYRIAHQHPTSGFLSADLGYIFRHSRRFRRRIEGRFVTATQDTRSESFPPAREEVIQPGSGLGAVGRHGVGATQRPVNRQLLEPPVSGLPGWFSPAAVRLREMHPAIAVLAVVAVWYLFLVAMLIGSGLLFTHILAHGRIGHWDDHVNSWFANHRSTTWNGISGDFTLLADTIGVAAVAAVVTLVLLVRRWGRLAMLLVIGLAVELAVFLSTTYLVARPRPRVQHVGGTPSTYSWPSGHSAATLVLYGGIAVLVMVATRRRFPRIVAWVVAVGLTLCVALSRIYRGEHHPTDTMAGVVLGLGALGAAVLAVRTWGMSAAAHAPGAAPSHNGLSQPVADPEAVS
jgi:membrane-associated phospholipid phosphatase